MASSPPGSPAGGIQRPMSAMFRSTRSSSRMSTSSRHGGGSRASDEDSKTAVKVAVRNRPPLNPSDPGYDLIPQRFRGSTVTVTSPSSLVVEAPSGKKVFVFDKVFDEETQQDGVFEYVRDGINSFKEGFNVSVLAYGQSGAGKSYTMGTTGPRDQADPEVMGIVPRAAELLFDLLDGHSGHRASGTGIRAPSRYSTAGLGSLQNSSRSLNNKNWQLKATYVEIYNEQLRDLLLPESTPPHERPTVTIREDTKGRIILTGLTQANINSVEDLLNALNFGSAIRQTDATAVNAKSSRSHAVFSLNLIQKKSSSVPTSNREKRMSVPLEAMSGNSDHWVTVDSKLHFVDLAGSERLKNTQAHGERAREGISINAGLAALGKVISQLSSRSAGSHVSYRDSKLTRLLQDSLGGNAITFMIACVNPAEFHLSETLNTVQYAQRARQIQIKPQIQQVSDDSDKQAVIDRLRAEISFLRDQIRLSERTDRKRDAPQERAERQQDRENDLQNRLLDAQENYNALSARHAKLISEITKARDNNDADTPMLKDAIGDSALERLKRSTSFADKVDSIILEYEKTIELLEGSLSNTRSSLSNSESELLEKETRIAFLESQSQQLQARIQKAIDREASNEEYVKTLEAQVDSSTSGKEKNDTTISDLRDKLAKARENEGSCEDYISTLEERLAENEQEAELMQREIDRLKHVVERQRSIGKLDNLLYELDHIRQNDTKEAENGLVNGHSRKDSDPFSEKRDSGRSSRQFANHVDAIEEEDSERPTTAGAEEHGTTDDTDEHSADVDRQRTVSTKDHSSEEIEDAPQSPAQSKYVADKLETVTQELFDLRMEHENTMQDYEKLASKYQEALRTLASLQDTVEARHRPSSFLADAGLNGLKEEDGQHSSSRTLSSELSLAGESTNTSNLEEDLEALSETSDAGTAQVKSGSAEDLSMQGEAQLAQELKNLKKLHAEKEERVAELNKSYAQLEEQHQDTLDYVEELKSEVHKVQLSARPSSPTVHIIRRKSSQNVMASDRSNRAFASLRNMALENFEEEPDLIQNFELNLNAIMTELHLRSERVQGLETEVASIRKEMEGKMALITGLQRERSSLKASAPLDMSIISTMQDQVTQSEEQLKDLKESHAQREQQLQDQIENLKYTLHTQSVPPSPGIASPSASMPGVFLETPATESNAKELGAESNNDPTQHKQVAAWKQEIAEWQSKHIVAMESMKTSEKQHREAVGELEMSMKNLRVEHDAHIAELERLKGADAEPDLTQVNAEHEEVVASLQKQVEEHRKTSAMNAARLAELEQSHANILQQVEDDSEARELTEKELQTHRSLVANLEDQIEEHKSAIALHQQRLDSTHESHSVELEQLNQQLLEAQNAHSEATEKLSSHLAEYNAATRALQEKLDAAQAEHRETTLALQAELSRAQTDMNDLLRGISSILGEDTDMTTLQSQIESLANNRKTLATQMEEATRELDGARSELSAAVARATKLEGTVTELQVINDETLKELENISDKERKSSRLVEELEDQLNQNWDQHEAANNRLSALQTERSRDLDMAMQRKEEVEREVEESRAKIALLESQLADVKRNSHRESLDPRDASLQRSNSNNSNLRKSTSHNSLPSPPPAIPLPPLPGSPPPTNAANAPSPPTSRHQSKDIAHAQLVEDQEARIRTIEKHLFAEKQLTATLEDALTDLEASSQRTKADMENWKKKCAGLEEELAAMRKERSLARHSLQAVEEERNARLRVEAERAHLEARMAALNNSNKKKSKKGGLNCF